MLGGAMLSFGFITTITWFTCGKWNFFSIRTVGIVYYNEKIILNIE